jgi:hypothetical protein
MYWRIGSEYHKRERVKNRSAFRRIVKRCPPPGLPAFAGELTVGWCQLTPRDDLPWLDRIQALGRVDGTPVWSISCFYVRRLRRGYRGQSPMSALVAAALRAAKRAGALGLEAYPVDMAGPGGISNVFTGTASTFERAGFRAVARRRAARPIMRHDLKGISSS